MLISEARLRKIIRETLKESYPGVVGLPAAERMTSNFQSDIKRYAQNIARTYLEAVGLVDVFYAAKGSNKSEDALRQDIDRFMLRVVEKALKVADERLQKLKDANPRDEDDRPGWLQRGELPPDRK